MTITLEWIPVLNFLLGVLWGTYGIVTAVEIAEVNNLKSNWWIIGLVLAVVFAPVLFTVRLGIVLSKWV